MNFITSKKESINPHPVQIDGPKIDPNPINLILPLALNRFNYVAIRVSKKLNDDISGIHPKGN